MSNLAEVHSGTTIMTELKQRTRQLHQETEAAVDIISRLRTRESYADLLSRFYGFYSPMEERLAKIPGWEAIGIDLAERKKSSLIAQDLKALGWTESRIAKIPICSTLPQVTELGAALGCLYVLEGSTLGAQHIRLAVESHLGLTADKGCRFFNGYGSEETAGMWHAFGASVIAYDEIHPDSDEKIISAASETFVRFKEWVARHEN